MAHGTARVDGLWQALALGQTCVVVVDMGDQASRILMPTITGMLQGCSCPRLVSFCQEQNAEPECAMELTVLHGFAIGVPSGTGFSQILMDAFDRPPCRRFVIWFDLFQKICDGLTRLARVSQRDCQIYARMGFKKGFFLPF